MHFLKRWNLEKAGAEYVSRVAISLGQLLYSHAGNDYSTQYSPGKSSFAFVNSLLNNWSYSDIILVGNKHLMATSELLYVFLYNLSAFLKVQPLKIQHQPHHSTIT
jgi:hypothetical protein